jgi:GntR family transcriptional regulator
VARPIRVESNAIVGYPDQTDPPTVESRSISERRERPPASLAARLWLPSGRVCVMTDLVLADGEPVAVRVTYDDADITQPPVVQREGGTPVREDLASTFVERYGRPLGAITTSVEAVPCEMRAAKLLGIPEHAPVLLREQLVRDVDGVVRLISQAHYRGDRCVIASEVSLSRDLPAR